MQVISLILWLFTKATKQANGEFLIRNPLLKLFEFAAEISLKAVKSFLYYSCADYGVVGASFSTTSWVLICCIAALQVKPMSKGLLALHSTYCLPIATKSNGICYFKGFLGSYLLRPINIWIAISESSVICPGFRWNGPYPSIFIALSALELLSYLSIN